MKATFEKVAGHVIRPADQQTAEWVESLKHGEGLSVVVKKERNLQFHKKFFAMLNMAHDNLDMDMSFESFRKSLIISAGYFEPEQLIIEGELMEFRKPKSMSFAKMDDLEFQELYDRCVDALAKYFNVELDKLNDFL